MMRKVMGSTISAVVFLAALLLSSGCLKMRGHVQLRDDGSLVAGGTLRSPLVSPEMFSVTNNPSLKSSTERDRWAIRALSDKEGWHGVALAKRFPTLQDVLLLATNTECVITWYNVEDDIYELRLDLGDQTATRFIGEEGAGQEVPLKTGFDFGALLACDLSVLLLRGIEFACDFQVPGEIVGTSLKQTGKNKVSIELVGDDIMRTYFERTEDIPEEEARRELLGTIIGEQVAASTNFWIRFRWPNGEKFVEDAAPAMSRTEPARRRTVMLTAPPPCAEVSSSELGSVQILSTAIKSSRSVLRPAMSHEVEWKISMPERAATDGKYDPLRSDKGELVVSVGGLKPTVRKSTLASQLISRGGERSRGHFVAKCSFTAGDPSDSVREVTGRTRMLLADRRARGHLLKPKVSGIYALQWSGSGIPTLELIEEQGDEIVIHCHRGTANYLGRAEDWKVVRHTTDRTIELTWKGKTPSPVPALRLHGKVSVCDYSFTLKRSLGGSRLDNGPLRYSP